MQDKQNKLETITNLFENSTIRSILNTDEVVDVINALANPKDARKYWSVLKLRLKKKIVDWLQIVVSWKC